VYFYTNSANIDFKPEMSDIYDNGIFITCLWTNYYVVYFSLHQVTFFLFWFSYFVCLQCFDAIGWVTGRVSGP